MGRGCVGVGRRGCMVGVVGVVVDGLGDCVGGC